MSEYNLTKSPAYLNGKQPVSFSGETAAQVIAEGLYYPSPMGWVAPLSGTYNQPTTSLTWVGGVVTVVAAGHSVVTGSKILIARAAPVAYNGYVTATVLDANTFTYPLTNNPTTATAQGIICVNPEVVATQPALDVLNADARVVPVYTASVSYSGTAAMITGDVLTVTLATSEPVQAQGNPTILATIGTGSASLVYDGITSTSTSLKFTHTILAGEHAVAGGVIIPNTISGGIFDLVLDILSANRTQPSVVSFTAPVTSAATVN